MRYSWYSFLTIILYPLIVIYIFWRLRKGKESKQRLGERFGKTNQPRPDGDIIWVHGASVGEAQAGLTLIARLKEVYPKVTILITSGTVTSADFIAARLDEHTIHQFVPVDSPIAVKRFLKHWKPQAGIWMESELWPSLVIEASRTGMPLFLVNARLSLASVEKWQKYPRLIKKVLACFTSIITQSGVHTDSFKKLGAERIITRGNIKFSSPPLTYDANAYNDLKKQIGDRPLWLAASTHLGEEEAAGHAHMALSETIPNLLTIIVPRHPNRGDFIASELELMDLKVARRSLHQKIETQTDVYVADTLGELGLFYRLAEIVFLGGSLAPIGGHNLLEPAQLKSAIIHGPHMHTQVEILEPLRKAGALIRLQDSNGLGQAVKDLFENPEKRHKLIEAACIITQEHTYIREQVINDIRQELDKVINEHVL